LNADELRSNLAQFIGTESYATLGPMFRHTLLTDGVQFLVEHAQCLWLITDAMAWLAPKTPEVDGFDHYFVPLKLKPNADHSALLTLEDGDYNELYRHEYSMTTFPLPEGIEIWVEWGEGPVGPTWVMMLPSER
jgi:hypothetical protein